MVKEICKNCDDVVFDAKFKIFFFSPIDRIDIKVVEPWGKKYDLSLSAKEEKNFISFTIEELRGGKNLIRFDLIQGNSIVLDSIYCFVFAPSDKDKNSKEPKVHELYQISGKWIGNVVFDGRNITELIIAPAKKAPLYHTHSIVIKTSEGKNYNSYLTFLNLAQERLFFTNPSNLDNVESNILINLPGGYVFGDDKYYKDIVGSRVLTQMIDEYVNVTQEGILNLYFTKLKGIRELRRWRFNQKNIEQVIEMVGLSNAEVYKSQKGYQINNLEILLVEGRCSESVFNLCNKHQGGDIIKLLVQEVYMEPVKFTFNRGV